MKALRWIAGTVAGGLVAAIVAGAFLALVLLAWWGMV